MITSKRRLRPGATLLGLLLLDLAWPAHAQEPAPPKVTVKDGATADPRLTTGDCSELVLSADALGLDVDVRMARPFAEGMYLRVHLWIDCDDSEATGIDGCELWVRAAAGTRFGPNTPRESPGGTSAPLDIRRGSWSDVGELSTVSTGKSAKSWLHRDTTAPPVVDGNRLSFRVPMDLIRERGERYHRRFRLYAQVETVCAEQPLLIDHACADEGLPITLDGTDPD